MGPFALLATIAELSAVRLGGTSIAIFHLPFLVPAAIVLPPHEFALVLVVAQAFLVFARPGSRESWFGALAMGTGALQNGAAMLLTSMLLDDWRSGLLAGAALYAVAIAEDLAYSAFILFPVMRISARALAPLMVRETLTDVKVVLPQVLLVMTAVERTWWAPVFVIASVVSVSRMTSRHHRLGETEEQRDAALEQARRDPLTGLLNRRGFDGELRADAEFTEASGIGAVICLDLDRFKSLNDRLGHQTGDLVLERTAHIIAEHGRAWAARCARFGGEEFVVHLPLHTEAAATMCAEFIRETVRSRLAEYGVTVSCGVSSDDRSGAPRIADGDDAVARFGRAAARADAYLYLAKRTGRDRVCSAARPSLQLADHDLADAA